MKHPVLPPDWGKINGEDHPDTTIANAASKAERARCVAVCQDWLDNFRRTEIKLTSANNYAADAIMDIIDAINAGHDPRRREAELP